MRVALLGTGFIAEFRARVYARLQGVEVVVREGRADLAVRGTLGLVALRDALRAVQLPPEAEVPELRLTNETLSLVAIKVKGGTITSSP